MVITAFLTFPANSGADDRLTNIASQLGADPSITGSIPEPAAVPADIQRGETGGKRMSAETISAEFGVTLKDGASDWQTSELEAVYGLFKSLRLSKDFLRKLELKYIVRQTFKPGVIMAALYVNDKPGDKYLEVFDFLYKGNFADFPPASRPGRRLQEALAHEIGHAWQEHFTDYNADGDYRFAGQSVINRRLSEDAEFKKVYGLIYARNKIRLEDVPENQKIDLINSVLQDASPREKTALLKGLLSERNLESCGKINDFARISGWKGVNKLTGETADFNKDSLDGLFFQNAKPSAQMLSSEAERAPTEDFAESVRYYVFYPEQLRMHSLEKYNYIKQRVFNGR